MSWTEYNLGELIRVKHGFAFKSEFFSPEGKHIVLTPGNFHESGGFKSRGDKDRFYSGEYPEQYLLKKDDLIVAMTEQGEGLLGSSSLIPDNDKFLHNQRLGLVEIIEPEKVEKYFLYLVFNNPIIRHQIAGSATGTKVKHTAPERIYRCKFKFPSRPLQKKIAAIIYSYNNFIENNLKRIKLLEEMAQITYEEWFVRMKFPGHETAIFDKETGLPEGWSASNLGHFIEHEIGGGWGEEEASKEFSESAYVIRGTDFDGLPTGKTQNVPLRWHKKSNLASRKLAPGDIIFEVSGGSQNEGVAKTVLMTEELLSLFNEDVMCASFCKLARPISTEVGHYLFYFLRFLRKIKASEVFEIRSASNIVNYNWTAFLKFQEVNFPSESLLDEFHTFSENSTKQTSVLAKQVKLLKEARDILLPRLMTGMIDIEQVELPEAMLERIEVREDKMATA
ncbi:restriction endonuclease subunit S [Paraglaciecola aquimarina]|uniref:Restriction endonuclease subunit S n=1 Tax=Paraglaciecola algarum TaxID=3050085 RepID=A0ABS9D9M9_9ALTE|nr:restriction endonuclease subunit S [Paraglaciecola sp. G1-23]MCF2948489.1 restriction endonuclease subunit S [Paraglaciecola sp. G1-23]